MAASNEQTPTNPTEQDWDARIVAAREATVAPTEAVQKETTAVAPETAAQPPTADDPGEGDIDDSSLSIEERKELATRLSDILIDPTTLAHNNLTPHLNFMVGDPVALQEKLEQITKSMSARKLLEELRNPASIINVVRLVLYTMDQSRTAQYRFLLEAMRDKLNKLVALDGAVQDKWLTGARNVSGTLTGDAARLNVLARLNGLRRVNLLNSGFWVTIRPFTIAELHAFYQTVDNEKQELGRHIGGLSCTFMDLTLKEKFMELFVTAVEASNLENWRSKDVLMNNISFHDYAICVWAVCNMIYKDGVVLTLKCANPECEYAMPNFQFDLAAMRLNDFDVTGGRAVIEEMLQRKVVTEAEALAYRTSAPFTKEVKYTIPETGAAFTYTFTVPTIGDHIRIGKALLQKVVSYLGTQTSVKDEACRTQLIINLYHMFLAWISKFTDVTDENVWSTTDRDAIMQTLDAAYHESTTFNADITAFIRATQASYIAYRGIKCPKCGAVVKQNMDVGDIVPVDVHHLFFVLCCRKIETIASRQHLN